MTRFRVDGVFLHVPTGETERSRQDFDTFYQAITVSCEVIRELQNDPDFSTLQTNSWIDLDGLRDNDDAEEIFGCHFSVADIQGMILVTALHGRADGDGQ